MHLQLNTTRTEHFVRRADVKLHVCDVEFRLVVMFDLADFLLPVFMHDLALGELVVFVLRQHIRRGDVGVSDARVDDVCACLRLILHGGGDVIRILQV